MQPFLQTNAARPDGIRLAHISDPHLTSLSDIDWRELLNKRLFGYLSWLCSRRHEHRPEILAALIEDLLNQKPDHILVTGDLTHLGTSRECTEARDWLNALGSPERITVIPGNHDCYARTTATVTVNLWTPYMIGDADASPRADGTAFPFLRRRGPAAVIALSTAHPSPVFLATGSAGHRQIATLESMLETARHENLFRIVMLHHPPTSENVSWRRRLIDGEALRAALKRHGAELVLHGHVHKRVYTTIRNAGGAIPVFGVPSASARGTVRAKRAGYNICEITATSTAWTLRVEERALSGTGPGLECIAEHHFNIPIPRPATTTLQQAAIVTPPRTAVPL